MLVHYFGENFWIIDELKLVRNRYKMSFAVTIPNVKYLIQPDNTISTNAEELSLRKKIKA